MTQWNKELLLRDLSARLPCGVILNIVDEDSAVAYGTFVGMTRSQKHSCLIYEDLVCIEGVLTPFRLEEVKPYLRPMSSMTKEEIVELKWLNEKCDAMSTFKYVPVENYRIYDWMNRHHFDYRGLIEKGLALEAPEGIYDIK